MENRARYGLIGAFVLVCILAGFGFVYWIANTGGIGARSVYTWLSTITGPGFLRSQSMHWRTMRFDWRNSSIRTR